MPGDQDVESLLVQQDWNAITKRLTHFAYRRLGNSSLETAKEVVQEALTRIWDPEYKDWDPAKEPDLLGHLGSVVNGIVSNWWKSARIKTERSATPSQLACRAGTDGRETDGKMDASNFLGRLLDRVGDDPMVTDLIFLMADGIDRPADQAAHLKCERRAVYNAIRRLDSHVAGLRANLALEDAHGL